MFEVKCLMFPIFSMFSVFSHPGWQDETICRALVQVSDDDGEYDQMIVIVSAHFFVSGR